jgi:DNA-binding MarR family transcriptional regulator
MTENAFRKVRDKDHAVLVCLHNGDQTVHDITRATTLSQREVNHCFSKLEELGLITVTRFPEDEYVTRIVDGQKRTFRRPKEAALTETGERYFAQEDADTDLGRFDAVEYEALVETVRRHDAELEQLQRSMTAFQRQVIQELRSGHEEE